MEGVPMLTQVLFFPIVSIILAVVLVFVILFWVADYYRRSSKAGEELARSIADIGAKLAQVQQEIVKEETANPNDPAKSPPPRT
jgi:hypothetical protein